MATCSSILAWRSHGQRSLASYSPQGSKELDTTKVTLATHSSVLAWRSLVGCSPWGLTESDTTEATWQQQSDLARIMTETLFQAMNNV